jgi:hypothetical protein
MRVEVGKAGAWQELWSNRVQELRGAPAADIALAQGFAATTAQLRDLGLDHNDLRRMVRRGEWSRPDRGVLSPVVVKVDGFDGERQAHALRSTAAALLRPNHVITGRSAAVLNALPVLASPREPVLTSRDDDSRGRRSGVHVRTAALRRSAVTSWFGAPVTTVPRTVVDLARLSRYDGIMAADAALHESLSTARALRGEVANAAGWPGVRQAREIIALADGDAESPLESLTRLALHDDGFPKPLLQRWIAGYQVDFVWPEYALILEADGRVKYAGDEGWVEKKRQLTLARAGYDVERILWSDLFAGWPAMSARLRPYFLRSAPRAVSSWFGK